MLDGSSIWRSYSVAERGCYWFQARRQLTGEQHASARVFRRGRIGERSTRAGAAANRTSEVLWHGTVSEIHRAIPRLTMFALRAIGAVRILDRQFSKPMRYQLATQPPSTRT